jgi:hydroxymethylpyrimidine/phosphomethylpyrimidine kinase
MKPVVLCIGGLDPAGRAGLLADVRAVEAMGGRVLAVATALTHQTSSRAAGFAPVSPEVVARQVSMLLEDEPVGAVKLGQLASRATARVLAPILRGSTLVLDTPFATTSGRELIPAAEREEAYGWLLPMASLVTPNLPEWSLLKRPAETEREAMRRLQLSRLLLKGGHRPGGDTADDLLLQADGDGVFERTFSAPRVSGPFRGTGCSLASAIAVGLARGEPVSDAVGAAKRWLSAMLASPGEG